MKQTAAVITAVTFYLGSLFAIDSAIANDHDRDDMIVMIIIENQ